MPIVITGATGQLGRLVIEDLIAAGTPAGEILALGRDKEKLAQLPTRTAHVDYADQDALESAFRGADAVLFISGSEVGRRIAQHGNVVRAAKNAGVGRIVYTSAPKADTTALGLAAEHLATENMIRESGIPFTFLRNGWYTENYTGQLAGTLQNGAVLGAAGDGRVSTAPRKDFAAAAAATLTQPGHENKIYELGGDDAFTLAELAAEITRLSGTPVTYRDLPQAEFAAALVGFGVPAPAADIYADADRGIAAGELFIDSGDLRRLIGRPTTPLAEVIEETLKTL
jgi:NAD(P)H dehydrogenase (quinone)